MKRSSWQLIKVGVLALIAVVGFDFFLHSGVLKSLYTGSGTFLLPADEAFRRIPIGYISFAVLVAFLMWLERTLGITTWKRGLFFGLIFGVVAWGSLVLGLYSISTASPLLLIGWFMGQTIELGIAGMVTGAGLSSNHLRPLVVKVTIFFLFMVILAIILQNIGNF